MRTPPLILIADDHPTNVDVIRARLAPQGYAIVTAKDGEEALAVALEQRPDLILLDLNMPKLDGLEVCRRLKADPTLPFMPVVMVTARTDSKDVVAGLEAGGDEYLTKPVDGAALVARVRSMLRIKELHDQVNAQAVELGRWSRTLERRVEEQVQQLERLGRLKRFFSPALADLIVGGSTDDPFRTHRREIAMLILNLGGFSAFAETAEPEEVMSALRQYYAEMGRVVLAHEGTLVRFVGDMIDVLVNDAVQVPNPAERAVRMAVDLRERARELNAGWAKHGWNMPLAIGIALGHATIGAIGFEERLDYGAVGRVTVHTAFLCQAARPDGILVSQGVAGAVEPLVELEEIEPLTREGFARPIRAFRVVGLKSPAEAAG